MCRKVTRSEGEGQNGGSVEIDGKTQYGYEEERNTRRRVTKTKRESNHKQEGKGA